MKLSRILILFNFYAWTNYIFLFAVTGAVPIYAEERLSGCSFPVARPLAEYHGTITPKDVKIDWKSELHGSNDAFQSIHAVTNSGLYSISFRWDEVGLMVRFQDGLPPGATAFQKDYADHRDHYETKRVPITLRADKYVVTAFVQTLRGYSSGAELCIVTENSVAGATISHYYAHGSGAQGKIAGRLVIRSDGEGLRIAFSNTILGVDQPDYSLDELLSNQEADDVEDIKAFLLTSFGSEALEHRFVVVRGDDQSVWTSGAVGVTPVVLLDSSHRVIAIGRVFLGTGI